MNDPLKQTPTCELDRDNAVQAAWEERDAYLRSNVKIEQLTALLAKVREEASGYAANHCSACAEVYNMLKEFK